MGRNCSIVDSILANDGSGCQSEVGSSAANYVGNAFTFSLLPWDDTITLQIAYLHRLTALNHLKQVCCLCVA